MFREHRTVSRSLLLLASQGMLEECKKTTRDTLTSWAFGKDTVYVVWTVFHAVCSCVSHLHLTWRARVSGIVVQCDIKYGMSDRTRIKSMTQKTKSGCADEFRMVTSGTALHLELQIRGAAPAYRAHEGRVTRCVENLFQADERSTPMSELRQELLGPGKRDIRRGLFLPIKICV